MDIRDQNGTPIDISVIEKPEQDLANQYIMANDVVFELGARYGSVSCAINSKLACKTNQVVVEPDERVWEALERNRETNQCEFHIIRGFVSNERLALTNLEDCLGGYGATYVVRDDSQIPAYTMADINEKYNLRFNVLVADCEGFLERFFDENPSFYDALRLVIFEADYVEKCDYNKIRSALHQKGLEKRCAAAERVVKMNEA